MHCYECCLSNDTSNTPIKGSKIYILHAIINHRSEIRLSLTWQQNTSIESTYICGLNKKGKMTTTFQTALSNTGSYCCCRRGFWLATKAVSSKMGSKKQHLGFALVSLVLSRELNPENCLVFSEEINQLIVCCCFQGWFECCISSLTRMAQYEFIQA